jgi:hypothetical protein
MRQEVVDTGPHGNRNGAPRQESTESEILKTAEGSHSCGLSASLGLVQQFLNSPSRDYTSIPFCLRTLEHAERELRHDGLALAISAAEWHYCDLVIWQAYPAEFARSECWRHIKVGIDWVRYLRRKRCDVSNR